METPAFVLDGSDHHMWNMLEERMKSAGNDYIASNNLVGTKLGYIKTKKLSAG